ncbi:MAG: hypothetical protein ABJ327_07515, partial [Litoreibacter sp.]
SDCQVEIFDAYKAAPAFAQITELNFSHCWQSPKKTPIAYVCKRLDFAAQSWQALFAYSGQKSTVHAIK